jgi:hypothetical protein
MTLCGTGVAFQRLIGNALEEHMAQQSRMDMDAPSNAGHDGRLDGRTVVHERSLHTEQQLRTVGAEPAMSELLKQLAAEGGELVRSELALAKLEMRDMGRELAADSAKVGAAVGLAIGGAFVLLAAAVIGLGAALGGLAGHYALSALIIGGVMLLVGGLMARSGIAGLKHPPKPEQTVESVQETKDWASREVRQFRQEIRS